MIYSKRENQIKELPPNRDQPKCSWTKHARQPHLHYETQQWLKTMTKRRTMMMKMIGVDTMIGAVAAIVSKTPHTDATMAIITTKSHRQKSPAKLTTPNKRAAQIKDDNRLSTLNAAMRCSCDSVPPLFIQFHLQLSIRFQFFVLRDLFARYRT